MSQVDDFDFGYGDVEDVMKETSGGGKFIKLEDDVTYQFRIVSPPRYAIRHWINKGNKREVAPCGGEDCQYCGKNVRGERLKKDAQWGWIVIDREDGGVKVLQGPNSVARKIKDLTQIRNKRTNQLTWGDPRTFDIQLMRTKKSNGFYEYVVNADPDSRGPLTEEEKQKVAEADINLEKEMNRAKKSDNLGNYDTDMETAPEGATTDRDIPDKMDDIDLDTLPF